MRIVILDANEDGAVYLRTAGEAWRVYDSIGDAPRRGDAVAPPDPMATHRHFVSHSGQRRVYAFGRKDSHALVPRLLMRQLTAARLAGPVDNPRKCKWAR